MCWGSVGDWIPPEGCHYYELVHGWVRVFAPILGCLVRTREWGREDFFIPPFDWFSWLSEALWSLLEWIIWGVFWGSIFHVLEWIWTLDTTMDEQTSQEIKISWCVFFPLQWPYLITWSFFLLVEEDMSIFFFFFALWWLYIVPFETNHDHMYLLFSMNYWIMTIVTTNEIYIYIYMYSTIPPCVYKFHFH